MLLYDASNRNLDKNKMEKKIDDIIINMMVTNEEVQYLEASTKNQSDSPDGTNNGLVESQVHRYMPSHIHP